MLNKFDRYKKEAIRLMKELDSVRKEILQQPFVEVPPFQMGWEVSIILRDDISNRNDADFIRHLINIGYKKFNIIKKIEYVRLIRKGILTYTWKSKYSNNINSIDFVPDRIFLSEKQYEKLSEREKAYFKKDRWGIYNYYNRNNYFLNIPQYWIKLKVKPRIFNKIMDKNGELESRYVKLIDKLHKPPYSKYYFGYRRKGYNIKHYKDEINKIKFNEQLKEYNERF